MGDRDSAAPRWLHHGAGNGAGRGVKAMVSTRLQTKNPVQRRLVASICAGANPSRRRCVPRTGASALIIWRFESRCPLSWRGCPTDWSGADFYDEARVEMPSLGYGAGAGAIFGAHEHQQFGAVIFGPASQRLPAPSAGFVSQVAGYFHET